jgi:hypothetical protein
MNFCLFKKILVLAVTLILSFSQAVFAGKDTEDSAAEQTTEDTESSTNSPASTSNFMQAMTVVGSVWGGLKILAEYKQFAIDYVRPFCVGIESVYSSGQNPFANPLHICSGIDRICETYSLTEKGRKNLRDFASPIISQLYQALIDNGGVLPYNFTFAKNTIRSLYFRGEPGSGKSRLVMEELPKIFLKDPQDVIIITNGKGFSESEDIISALLETPQYRIGMDVSLLKQRNLGERIRANAGRGIVVFDDYTKYNTPALDKCILSLHDEGKLNTPQGEIDCPAMLFFFSSDETEEEFLICPEQTVERIVPARRLSEDSEEIIPERTIVRKVGHPEGFVRKTRTVSLTRLNGEFLKDILNNHFLTEVLPVTWRNARVELSNDILDELVRLNESCYGSIYKAFDMSSLQTALLDFRKEFNFSPQASPDLVIDYKDHTVKVLFKNPEEEDEYQTNSEDTRRELDLNPVQQIGCFKSFCRRFGISSCFSSLCGVISSCFCCNNESLEDEDLKYEGNTSQNPNYYRNSHFKTKTTDSIDTQDSDEEQLSSSDDILKQHMVVSKSCTTLPKKSHISCFKSKSYSCAPREARMEEKTEEIHARLFRITLLQ